MTSRTSRHRGRHRLATRALTNQLLGVRGSARAAIARSCAPTDDAVDAAQEHRLSRAWSSRSTATTAAASALDLRSEDDVRRGLQAAPATRAAAATSSSRRSSPATTTACSSSAAGWSAVAQRVPGAASIGDGKHTVRELVEIENATRGAASATRRCSRASRSTTAAEELVAQAGLRPRRRAARGHAGASSRSTGNMSTGGTSIDRTLEAHPDNIEIAETAARVVGLDVAGIDFIAPGHRACRCASRAARSSRSTPRRASGCTRNPTEGEPQYVAKPVIDLLFPPGSNARIPIVGVTGTNGKTTTVRMIAPHPEADGPAGGHDHDGRHRHRRPADQEGRHERARSRRRWCSRTRPSTRPCSRWRAAASCARASATTATTSRS